MSDADWWWVSGYVLMLTLASVVSSVLLVIDQRRAERRGWRIPESTLHGIELMGGWPGSWLTRRAIRHKTQKLRYRAMFAAAVIVHLGLVGAFAWWRWGG